MANIPRVLQLVVDQFNEQEQALLLKDTSTGYPLLVEAAKDNVVGNVPGDFFYSSDEAAIAFVLNYKIMEIQQECLGSIIYHRYNNRWYFTQGLTLPQQDEQRSTESINLIIAEKASELALQGGFYALVCTSELDGCNEYKKYIVSEDGILKFKSN